MEGVSHHRQISSLSNRILAPFTCHQENSSITTLRASLPTTIIILSDVFLVDGFLHICPPSEDSLFVDLQLHDLFELMSGWSLNSSWLSDCEFFKEFNLFWLLLTRPKELRLLVSKWLLLKAAYFVGASSYPPCFVRAVVDTEIGASWAPLI